MNIKDIVNDPEWQDLRKSLVGTWKKTPEQNTQKLRDYLEDMKDIYKLRRVHNYLTGSGFRIGIISHPSITQLLEEVKNKRRYLWKLQLDQYGPR